MLQKIVLGGGCFWCLEAVFQDLKGVAKVVSGYAGGTTPNPSYDEVCTGKTGHAEVVEIFFDNTQVKLEDLLNIFWHLHDPTTLNRQGNDIGTQYRSIIFYSNEDERQLITDSMNHITEQQVYTNPLVTQIEPLQTFYPAEDYHQNYFRKNPNQGYCQLVINPKIAKLRKHYYDKLKS